MINLRDEILKNQKTYYNGLIAKHQQNVEIYLNQPVGIGEHSDVMAAIDTEINAIAQAHEKIGIIDSYFLGRQMAVSFSLTPNEIAKKAKEKGYKFLSDNLLLLGQYFE